MDEIIPNEYETQAPGFVKDQQFQNFFYDMRYGGGVQEEDMIDPDQILLTESDVSFDSTLRETGLVYAQ